MKLQDEQILYYFKKGLRPEILPILLLHNPTTLEDMLKFAQVHEQGMDFANDAVPSCPTTTRNYEKEIEQLTKQMQQMSINYATIASALVAQTEKNSPQASTSKPSSKAKDFSCYKCGEPGHIARNCMSEKSDVVEKTYKIFNNSNNKVRSKIKILT